MSELVPISGEIVKAPAAAEMRYEPDDPDAVTRVFIRVEYAGGRIREYQAREPRDFKVNDPESAPSMVFSRGMSETREVRLSFRPNPRWNLHIRTEATAPAEFEGITYG